jgi:hypothetical protein
MARFPVSTGHHWLRQQVRIDGQTFFHRQGLLCWRDFARSSADAEWRAVHVGVLKYDFFDEEPTRLWVSQDCPGRQLLGEGNDESMQRVTLAKTNSEEELK